MEGGLNPDAQGRGEPTMQPPGCPKLSKAEPHGRGTLYPRPRVIAVLATVWRLCYKFLTNVFWSVGFLVPNYLMEKDLDSYSYLKKVSAESHLYNGFNLLTAEFKWVKSRDSLGRRCVCKTTRWSQEIGHTHNLINFNSFGSSSNLFQSISDEI